MKLTLLERLTIQKILPQEGNFATLKILDSLKMSLAPSEEEFKEFGIVLEQGKATWNEKGLEEREIVIGEKASEIIKETLIELDKNKKLSTNHISIYEKFV
jgi:hypothetical protein